MHVRFSTWAPRERRSPRTTVDGVERVEFPPAALGQLRGFTIWLQLDAAPAGNWCRAKENQKTLEPEAAGDVAVSEAVAKKLGVSEAVAANLETGEGVFTALKAATRLGLTRLRGQNAP